MEHPTCWPTDLRSALIKVSDAASPAKRRELHHTAASFAQYCSETGRPIRISKETLLGFSARLRDRYSPKVAGQKLHHLYELGTLGPDLVTRDYLFENFPDRRTIGTVLASPWWPNIPRVLAAGLETSERGRVIRELDNFFRWRQRTADVHESGRLRSLFLAERMSFRTRYQRLSRLCKGLDVVLPGDPDLFALREMQRQLHCGVWPPKNAPRRAARRIPAVEALLAVHRHPKTGEPTAEDTRRNHRRALNLHHDLLSAVSRSLSFDRASLDIYADHALDQLEKWTSTHEAAAREQELHAPETGWCRQTASSMCQWLAPFILDTELKREWYVFARSFEDEAKARGDAKRKERALAERPMGLDDLFMQANHLCRRADATLDVQVRRGILTVIGALGILLFYPLRRSDLLRLRFGQELTRERSRWLLWPGQINKSGTHIDPLWLPPEASPLLDTCLLQGAPGSRIRDVYDAVAGFPLLRSPRRAGPYHSCAFGTLFKRWVGHPPHIVRTIWSDELVAGGADRATIGAMLQHRSLISQEHYEHLAAKMRRARALDAIKEISDRLMSD